MGIPTNHRFRLPTAQFLQSQNWRSILRLVLALQLAAQAPDFTGLFARWVRSGPAGHPRIGSATPLPLGLNLLNIQSPGAAILAQLMLIQAGGCHHPA